MDLSDLSVFVEAVRAGGLSEAARRTGSPLAFKRSSHGCGELAIARLIP